MTRSSARQPPVLITLSGLLSASGTLVCFLTIAGFLNGWHWILGLTCHFRLQYGVILAALTGWAFWRRRRGYTGLFGSFALINFAVLSPYWAGGPARPTDETQRIRVMSVNVSTGNPHHHRLLAAIASIKPDLIVLTEVNERWLKDMAPLQGDFRHSVWEPREDNFGIALLSRLALGRPSVVYLGEAGVPSILAEVETEAGRLALLAMHTLPPASKVNTHLRDGQLAAAARELEGIKMPKLLVGDLNTSPWSDVFARLCKQTGLQDCAKGRGLRPTWPTLLPPMLIPLDYCLVSPEFAVAEVRRGPNIGSDHYPLVVELGLRSSESEGNK